MAAAANNLGDVLQDLGDLPGAKAFYEQALAIYRRFLPEGHSSIEDVQGNLETVIEDMRNKK